MAFITYILLAGMALGIQKRWVMVIYQRRITLIYHFIDILLDLF